MKLHYWWSRPDQAWLVADQATDMIVAKSISMTRVYRAFSPKHQIEARKEQHHADA